MYDFLRRPTWILSHVLVALLVVAMIGLGFWQRARWMEESDKVARLEARAQLDAVPYADAVGSVGFESFPDELRFTRVEAAGTYDVGAEVAVLNRSQGGAPGAWVLTPLVQADGTAVPVLRGWIPYQVGTGALPPFEEAAPPEGEVRVVGTLQPSQVRGSIGSVDPESGTLTELARVDLERLAQQLPYELGPAWVLLVAQDPPTEGALPAPVDLVADDPSQNFSYMVQWWIFAVIAGAGYPLVLRSVARHRLRSGEVEGDVDGARPGDGDVRDAELGGAQGTR